MTLYHWNAVKAAALIGVAALAYLVGAICSAVLFD